MAYYDTLKTKWATLSGTTASKLAQINAMTVAGPNIDVDVSTVVGTLMLTQAYLPLAAFAQGATNGNATHDTAIASAKMLTAILTLPNVPPFKMSDPTTYATIKGMMDAILAQETASSGSTGFTQTVHDALLALATTNTPWWQSVGLLSAVSQADLDMAGLS